MNGKGVFELGFVPGPFDVIFSIGMFGGFLFDFEGLVGAVGG